MRYITYADLVNTIRRNLGKIPHDIDFVIGVPRSGMLPATIISEYLNVPLIDLQSFTTGLGATGGGRLSFSRKGEYRKVLVVDDTVYNGTAMRLAKSQLRNLRGYEYIYMVVYLEGRAEKEVDLYLEDVRQPGLEIVKYEWNIFHHYPGSMYDCMYDIDGVFCEDPCDERKTSEYESYIANPVPVVVPEVVGKIVTYRLEKYREVTENWLKKLGVKYDALVMFPANSWEERYRSGISPEQFKADIYSQNMHKLFVESNDYQARRIFELSHKPVLCFETNKIYQ